MFQPCLFGSLFSHLKTKAAVGPALIQDGFAEHTPRATDVQCGRVRRLFYAAQPAA
jgi:hypothetical protein